MPVFPFRCISCSKPIKTFSGYCEKCKKENKEEEEE